MLKLAKAAKVQIWGVLSETNKQLTYSVTQGVYPEPRIGWVKMMYETWLHNGLWAEIWTFFYEQE